MDRYQHFEVEDFVTDEYFIEWVLQPQPDHDHFWQHWLLANAHQVRKVDRAKAVIKSIQLQPLDSHFSSKDIHDITAHFNQHTTRKKYSLKLSWMRGVAAAVLLAILGLWYFNQGIGLPKHEVDLAAARTSQKIVNSGSGTKLIQLPDKSIVILKPNSILDFPSTFDENIREVSLKGEAFFEVRPDANRPFFVKADRLTTMVLGTSFDVISPADGGESAVVVKTGKVKVFQTAMNGSSLNKIDSVVLLPNQKVVCDPSSQKLAKKDIATPLMLSYIEADKVLSFNNAPLSEIIKKLEEAYGVSIKYNTEKFKDLMITASLSRLPLEEKISAICKAIDAKYQFEEKQIEIY